MHYLTPKKYYLKKKKKLKKNKIIFRKKHEILYSSFKNNKLFSLYIIINLILNLLLALLIGFCFYISIASSIILLIGTIIYLLYLLLFRPYLNKWNLIVEVISYFFLLNEFFGVMLLTLST